MKPMLDDGRLIISVDFDGTLVESKFPEILAPKLRTIHIVKKLKAKGHILILWTCREGKALQEALKYLEPFNIEFDYINDNCDELIEMFGINCRKVSSDIHIDDKVINVANIGLLEGVEFVNTMEDSTRVEQVMNILQGVRLGILSTSKAASILEGWGDGENEG